MSAFDHVIGHEAVCRLLESEASSPAHAYLFIGASGVGKATVARRFAALVLDDGRLGETDRVERGLHPDLVLVEPDGRTSLTVDRARATVARAVLAPVEANRKVFLFEEAGAMNDGAANALLKTLEEPTDSTVFILITESEDDLPATVASRSRTVLFGRVTDGEIVAALQADGVERDQAEKVAAASGGRPGLALMLATRPEVAAFREAWLSVPGRLGEHPGEAFRLADELVSAAKPLLEELGGRQEGEAEAAEAQGFDPKLLKERHERERKRASSALHAGGLELLASWYRDAAAAQFGAPVRNRDLPGADLAGVGARDAVIRARRVLETIDALDANQRPELAFADLFASLGTQD